MIEDGSVVYEVFYPHPPSRVWDALTDAEQLKAWLPELAYEKGSAEPEDPPEDEAYGGYQVVEEDRPHRLWWKCSGPFGATEVRFTLTPEGKGTRLRIEHDLGKAV